MKKELRGQLLKQRNTLPVDYIRQASQTIQDTLLGLPVFQNAETVMAYISMGSETYTNGIIEHLLQIGKRVALPYLHKQPGKMEASEVRDLEQELILGKFNTRVPKPEFFRPLDPKDIDLIVVPAVAFDVRGNRLGYGGGYYDRYLKQITPETVLLGINFSVQVLDELPAYPHDMPVDIIVHEKGMIHATNKVKVHL